MPLSLCRLQNAVCLAHALKVDIKGGLPMHDDVDCLMLKSKVALKVSFFDFFSSVRI